MIDVSIWVMPENLNCTTDHLFDIETRWPVMPMVGDNIFIFDVCVIVTKVSWYFPYQLLLLPAAVESASMEVEASDCDLKHLYESTIKCNWDNSDTFDSVMAQIKEMRD